MTLAKIKEDIAEDCQNDNLLIGYQLLVFYKDLTGRRRSFRCLYGHVIHYFEDASTLKGLNFVGIKFRGFRQNRDIKSQKIINFKLSQFLIQCPCSPFVITIITFYKIQNFLKG